MCNCDICGARIRDLGSRLCEDCEQEEDDYDLRTSDTPELDFPEEFQG